MESIHTDKPTYYVCAQRLTQFEKISHQFTFFWMRKFAVLTCSLFKTSETGHESLSCIVMQPLKTILARFLVWPVVSLSFCVFCDRKRLRAF